MQFTTFQIKPKAKTTAKRNPTGNRRSVFADVTARQDGATSQGEAGRIVRRSPETPLRGGPLRGSLFRWSAARQRRKMGSEVWGLG